MSPWGGLAKTARHLLATGAGKVGSAALATGFSLGLAGAGRLISNWVAIAVFGSLLLDELAPMFSRVALPVVLLTVPLGSIALRFVPRCQVQGDLVRAKRLTATVLLGSATLSLVIGVGGVVVRGEERFVAVYAVGLGVYTTSRLCCYAWGRHARFLFAECASLAALLLLLTSAWQFQEDSLVAWGMAIAPGVAGGIGIASLRDVLATRPSWRHLGRPQLSFAVASLVSAIAGLGSYHILILVADLVATRDGQVASVTLMLSVLAPLNLLAAAFGPAVLPILTAGHERGDRLFVTRAVQGLGRMFWSLGSVALMAGCGLNAIVLPTLGLAASAENAWLWGVLVVSFATSIGSSPWGMYLNATGLERWEAALGLAGVAVSVAIGLLAGSWFGIAAVGAMRISQSAVLAVGRGALVRRVLGKNASGLGRAFATMGGAILVAVVALETPALWPVHAVLFLGATCVILYPLGRVSREIIARSFSRVREER